MRVNLEDFVGAVDGEATNAAALARMKWLYSHFAQEDFVLLHGVNFHGPDKRRDISRQGVLP